MSGLDRHGLGATCGEFRQEGVAGRALVNDRGIAEADMDRRLTLDAVEGAIQRLLAVGAGLFRPYRLRLLRHRERPRNRHLDAPLGVGAQEADVTSLDDPRADQLGQFGGSL